MVRGIPGVRSRNKATGMAAKAKDTGARAHTASDAATPPDGKPVLVSSQRVQTYHRSGLVEPNNNNKGCGSVLHMLAMGALTVFLSALCQWRTGEGSRDHGSADGWPGSEHWNLAYQWRPGEASTKHRSADGWPGRNRRSATLQWRPGEGSTEHRSAIYQEERRWSCMPWDDVAKPGVV